MPNSAATIKNNLLECRSALPEGVKLVAVSKFHPVDDVRAAYEAGQRLFGESRADELTAKAEAMPKDVEWHFIGHLQTNKVRRVVAAASVIESVDSERLLRLIDAEALRIGRTDLRVLLQVHVAAEETKTGFTPEELTQILQTTPHELKAVKIVGVMGMATNTDNTERIRADFSRIAACSREVKRVIANATEVSMGMSHDWKIAVHEGATMVRIGTAIFGNRG